MVPGTCLARPGPTGSPTDTQPTSTHGPWRQGPVGHPRWGHSRGLRPERDTLKDRGEPEGPRAQVATLTVGPEDESCPLPSQGHFRAPDVSEFMLLIIEKERTFSS